MNLPIKIKLVNYAAKMVTFEAYTMNIKIKKLWKG